MFLTDCVMIDIAHHVDHFAGDFFGSSRVAAVLVFLGDRKRSNCQRRDDCRNDRYL